MRSAFVALVLPGFCLRKVVCKISPNFQTTAANIESSKIGLQHFRISHQEPGNMKKKVIYSLIVATLLSVAAFGQTPEGGWDLQRCIEYAVANNITVKQSVLNQETAENNLTRSKASRLPSLSASGSQSLTKGTSTDPITYDFVSQTIHSTSVGLNAQVTVYNGSKINNTIKQNGLLVSQNSYYVAASKNDISLQVTEAYLQALSYKEGITIAENNLKSSEAQATRSQALFDAGSIAMKDLADVKSQLASDRYTLVTAKNAYDHQVLTLKQLLELEPEQSFELAFPSKEQESILVIPDKYTVYKEALAIMPEIKSGKLQTDVATLDLKIAKAGYQPTLSMTGGLSTGYTNTQRYTFSEQFNNNFNQRLGLTLSIPIFNGLQARTNVQNSRIEIQSAELNLTAARKTLYQKIENAHQQATAAQSEMEAAAAQRDASKVAYDLAQQQYAVGAVNTVDLLVSQNTYLQAQQKYTQAKYTAILYYQLLQFYEGNPIKM
jgi:outer membrane protein